MRYAFIWPIVFALFAFVVASVWGIASSYPNWLKPDIVSLILLIAETLFVAFVEACAVGLVALGAGLLWLGNTESVFIAQVWALTSLYLFGHSQIGAQVFAYPLESFPALWNHWWPLLLLGFIGFPLIMRYLGKIDPWPEDEHPNDMHPLMWQ